MKRSLPVVLACVVLLAACGGSPVGAPASSGISPSAPAGDWQTKWNNLIGAAKKEGTLTIAIGPGGGPAARQSLPPAFKQDFGIDMQILVASAPELVTRAKLEQSAGQQSFDALLLGADSMYASFYGEKLIEPLRPALIHPDALDGSKWVTGKPWFMDPDEQYILRVSNGLSGFTSVNTDSVSAADLAAWQDLLKPQFKGRIMSYDPTINGSGAQHAAFLEYTLGDDFVRQLYKGQQMVITKDTNQFADWLGHNKYPIALAMPSSSVESLRKDGLRVEVVTFKEHPAYLTAGSGLLAKLKSPPHPNAAALFANWMAMDRGQTVWNASQGYVGSRTSLKNDWVPDYVRPKPGVDYLDTYRWDYVEHTYPDNLKKVRQAIGAG